MLESKIAIKLARARYAHCISLSADHEKRADMREWLREADLEGSYRFYIPSMYETVGASLNRTEVYFSHEDAAFAFKMRWA